jgi:hypothetical protein
MKRIAVMQPYLFPYIGYFQLISAVDKFVLLDDVHYINKGWINRNTLLVNGKVILFTIPLEKASQNKLIKDIKISFDKNWKETFIKTIECAYKKAICFDAVFPLLKEIIFLDEELISKLVYYSLKKILDYLGIKTNLIASSVVYDNAELKAQHKIIDICVKERADYYINAIGGKELYDRNVFEQAQLKLVFIRPVLKAYNQLNPEFMPGLSIIDVLMHNTPQQVNQLLNEFVLEEAE